MTPSRSMFARGRIGPVELKNRVVMAAMTTGLADSDGFAGEAMLAWFEARAQGGAGLITVGPAAIENRGRPARELALDDDRFVAGLARLSHRLHAAGARCAIQLGHLGGEGRADAGETVPPSAMARTRIAACAAAHVAAARRAADAGFDLVELPVCDGALIFRFLNPRTNRRSDAYGGTLENRARFLLEVLRAIRCARPELPVIVRLGADDGSPGGIEAQETVRVARWVAAAGAAAVHIAGGSHRLPSAAPAVPAGFGAAPGLLEFAARLRGEIAAPVILGGGFGDPSSAAAALAAGRADFIALGRALIADPAWVRKAAGDKPVRRCLACNACLDAVGEGGAIHCVVNPWAGCETALPEQSPLAGQRICVVGAGPAGLAYSACVAAANRVTILERAPLAGGALRLAAKAPLFEAMRAPETALLAYVAALEKECRDQGVDFRFGIDAERASGALAGFDRVVIATGADYPPLTAAVAKAALGSGSARHRPLSALIAPQLRQWVGSRWRRPTDPKIAMLAPAGAAIEIVGDARRPGDLRAAIDSAIHAALYPSARTGAGCRTASKIPSSGAASRGCDE